MYASLSRNEWYILFSKALQSTKALVTFTVFFYFLVWSRTPPSSGGSAAFSTLIASGSGARCTTSCRAFFGVQRRSTFPARSISLRKPTRSPGFNSVPSRIISIGVRIILPFQTPPNPPSSAFDKLLRTQPTSAAWTGIR